MNSQLPNAEELAKLPLRAVVAYAARAVRRLSSELRGIVADEILDHAFETVNAVSTTQLSLAQLDSASVVSAAARVAGAYADTPAHMKTLRRFRAVFSVTDAALAAMNAIEATASPINVRSQMKNAANAALRAVRVVEMLDQEVARVMRLAAKQDYNLLLRKYGEHDEVIEGDPIDCFRDE